MSENIENTENVGLFSEQFINNIQNPGFWVFFSFIMMLLLMSAYVYEMFVEKDEEKARVYNLLQNPIFALLPLLFVLDGTMGFFTWLLIFINGVYNLLIVYEGLVGILIDKGITDMLKSVANEISEVMDKSADKDNNAVKNELLKHGILAEDDNAIDILKNMEKVEVLSLGKSDITFKLVIGCIDLILIGVAIVLAMF